MSDETLYDVAILGSGLAGAILGAILARHGAKVLLLEAGSHPRFAIGESTVPEFGAVARVMAEYFDVPELTWFSNFQNLRHRVSANSGVKRNFSFLHHRPGEEVRPREAVQFPTLTYPIGPDTHLYRPDVDAWLTALAVQYGVTYRERTRVEAIELSEEEVGLQVGKRRYRARYLVDGSGYNSQLADQLGLRQAPQLRTDSRTLFTHVVGARELAALGEARRLGLPSAPDQGTLHHLFEGGWFWVIPFDNHAQGINRVCSVGLTLDRRAYPDTEADPEEEFFEFVNRFPLVRRQLGGARAVRSWVGTGRVQYESAPVLGTRWCLLPHTASFHDPLFSNGLTQTLHGVRHVASALLLGLRAGDVRAPAARQRLEAYAEGLSDAQRFVDMLVHGAYVAFRSPALFNAWYRVWAVSNYYASTGYIRLHLRYLETRDRGVLEQQWERPYRRVLAFDQPRVRSLIAEGHRAMTAVDAGELEPQAAAAALYRLLGKQDWIPPQFRVTRASHRHVSTFTVLPLMSVVSWGKRRAPRDIRDHYYDIGPVYFWELTKSMACEGWRSLSNFLRVYRAAHVTRGRI